MAILYCVAYTPLGKFEGCVAPDNKSAPMTLQEAEEARDAACEFAPHIKSLQLTADNGERCNLIEGVLKQSVLVFGVRES